MTIDLDGFLANLDRFRADVLARLEADEGMTADELGAHQPALLAYTAGAVIAQLRARVAEVEGANVRLAEALDAYAMECVRAAEKAGRVAVLHASEVPGEILRLGQERDTARAQARREATAEIVAWLRARGTALESRRYAKPSDAHRTKDRYQARARECANAADTIERGDHLGGEWGGG